MVQQKQITQEVEETAGKIEDKYTVYFEDGGKDVVYVIDGIENHCLVPPAGFDPLTASDEELEKYCFPPRPEDKNDLTDWEYEMSFYRSMPEPELIPRIDGDRTE